MLDVWLISFTMVASHLKEGALETLDIYQFIFIERTHVHALVSKILFGC